MKKELIIEYPQKINLAVNYSGIVIGDEGCIYRALDNMWNEIFLNGIKEGVSIRYLTPIVPHKYVEKLYYKIQDLASIASFKVTFNDYGLLYLCKDLIARNKIIPVAGRILTRSILECPWYRRLLENESDELINVLSGYTFSHNAKLDFLKDCGINEIELNLRELGSLDLLKKQGIILTGHISNAIAAVGRNCYSARWYDLKKPECKSDIRCRNKLTIDVNQIWGKKRLMYEEPNEEMKTYYKGCFIKGNIVYYSIASSSIADRLQNFNHIIASND